MKHLTSLSKTRPVVAQQKGVFLDLYLVSKLLGSTSLSLGSILNKTAPAS